jgi:glycosyltransferase involved in cell wall biosynthesis
MPISDDPGSPRAAVVHEWLASRAGSEKVFEQLAGLLPTAQLFALTKDPTVEFSLDNRQVRTTVLDNAIFRRHRAATLPLMPPAWKLVRGNYDLIVSSHHAFAKGASLAKSGYHISYVHTPARYLWDREVDDRGQGPIQAALGMPLRWLDKRDLRFVDALVANSEETRRRIQRHWNRDATVVFPPVDTDFYCPCDEGQEDRDKGYILGVSRFIPYKRLDLVIELGERLGIPVMLAGHGPLELSLRHRAQRAKVPVSVVVAPGDQQLRELYRNALCLVYPALEDFGIVPVEAQACGTPVVAVDAGGTSETVADGVSGALVAEAEVDSLESGLVRALNCSQHLVRRNALKFSAARFDCQMSKMIEAAGFGGLLCRGGQANGAVLGGC